MERDNIVYEIEILKNAPIGDGHYEKIYKYKLTN